MTVKRYTPTQCCEYDGTYVTYSDYKKLVAENASMLKLLTDVSDNHTEYFNESEDGMYADIPLDYVSEINMYVSRDVNAENPFETTDAAIAEIKGQGRVEGVIFTANRMLAAWEHGFINASEEKVADITGAVLGMLEFLPNAEASELTREYADEARARIAANLRAGRNG